MPDITPNLRPSLAPEIGPRRKAVVMKASAPPIKPRKKTRKETLPVVVAAPPVGTPIGVAPMGRPVVPRTMPVAQIVPNINPTITVAPEYAPVIPPPPPVGMMEALPVADTPISQGPVLDFSPGIADERPRGVGPRFSTDPVTRNRAEADYIQQNPSRDNNGKVRSFFSMLARNIGPSMARAQANAGGRGLGLHGFLAGLAGGVGGGVAGVINPSLDERAADADRIAELDEQYGRAIEHRKTMGELEGLEARNQHIQANAEYTRAIKPEIERGKLRQRDRSLDLADRRQVTYDDWVKWKKTNGETDDLSRETHRAWQRNIGDRRFDETVRQHNLTDADRNAGLEQRGVLFDRAEEGRNRRHAAGLSARERLAREAGTGKEGQRRVTAATGLIEDFNKVRKEAEEAAAAASVSSDEKREYWMRNLTGAEKRMRSLADSIRQTYGDLVGDDEDAWPTILDASRATGSTQPVKARAGRGVNYAAMKTRGYSDEDIQDYARRNGNLPIVYPR